MDKDILIRLNHHNAVRGRGEGEADVHVCGIAETLDCLRAQKRHAKWRGE